MFEHRRASLDPESFEALRLEKMRKRRVYLREHPEMRVVLKLEPLQSILPESQLYLAKGCSLIRNQAVLDVSDLDDPHIVTPYAATVEAQDAYIEEVRRQRVRVDVGDMYLEPKFLTNELFAALDPKKRENLRLYSEDKLTNP